MQPENNPSPSQTTPKTATNAKNSDDYARALATMATIDYQMRERSQPETKHFISKKMLISIIISLILSILTLVIGKVATRKDTPAQDSQTVDQLLQTTKDVRDLENQ